MAKVSVKRHLKELQWRLVLVAFFFIAGATLAYTYQAQLVPFLLHPLHGEKLIYLNPAGGFSFIFLVSIYAGIALSMPVLFQQIYAFLRPALPERARKKSLIIMISSFLLMAAGITFGYFVAVPNALAFLYGFAEQYINASLTAESYLNFVIAYTVGIGIVFQLPLLLTLIHTIKPLTPKGLLKSEKWVVLVAFIIAAIITPTPDPVNQAIIAGPVVVVYQIGVIAVLISIAREKRVRKKQQHPATTDSSIPAATPVISRPTPPRAYLQPQTTPLSASSTPTPTAPTTQKGQRAMDIIAPAHGIHQHSNKAPSLTTNNTPSTAPTTPMRRSMDGVILARATPQRLVVPPRPTTTRAAATLQAMPSDKKPTSVFYTDVYFPAKSRVLS